MDARSNPLQDPFFTLKRYPAGDLPGQSRPLAGLLLCLQSLPVLRLLPGSRALHPPVPAAAPAHSQADAPQCFDCHRLAGGRPPVPEDCWYLMNGDLRVQEDFLKEKPFLPQGFSSLFSFSFFPFPFCSLKQRQNPLFVSSAVPEVTHLAVLYTALN